MAPWVEAIFLEHRHELELLLTTVAQGWVRAERGHAHQLQVGVPARPLAVVLYRTR